MTLLTNQDFYITMAPTPAFLLNELLNAVSLKTGDKFFWQLHLATQNQRTLWSGQLAHWKWHVTMTLLRYFRQRPLRNVNFLGVYFRASLPKVHGT